MMAHSNIEAASLSDLAHQALIDRGVLDRKALLVVGGTMGSAIRAYHRGDRIVFTRNDSMLAIRDASRAKVGSVLNGMVGTVVAYNHVFHTLVVEVEGGTVALPLAYVEAHTAYGYAFTVAKLQSSTVSGRAQVFRPETLSAADFLVAASRATDGTTFNFLATPGGAAGEGHPAAEWDEATPESYLTGLLASLATRLDRESISVGASSVLLAQSEAQRLAGLLGPHGNLGVSGHVVPARHWQGLSRAAGCRLWPPGLSRSRTTPGRGLVLELFDSLNPEGRHADQTGPSVGVLGPVAQPRNHVAGRAEPGQPLGFGLGHSTEDAPTENARGPAGWRGWPADPLGSSSGVASSHSAAGCPSPAARPGVARKLKVVPSVARDRPPRSPRPTASRAGTPGPGPRRWRIADFATVNA